MPTTWGIRRYEDDDDECCPSIESEKLKELKELVRDYLKHPSMDGRPERQLKREKLKKFVEMDH